MCNRLQPQDSYINGHFFFPKCAHTGDTASICICEDGNKVFNCTKDDSQEEVKIYRTTGTASCVSDGFVSRRKREAVEDERQLIDDDVILPGDIPVPGISPNVTDYPPDPTWPTPSGITKQQATDACQRVLESYAAYNTCRQYVNFEPLIQSCVLNIQARRRHVALSF